MNTEQSARGDGRGGGKKEDEFGSHQNMAKIASVIHFYLFIYFLVDF